MFLDVDGSCVNFSDVVPTFAGGGFSLSDLRNGGGRRNKNLSSDQSTAVGLMTGYSSAELRIAGFSSVLRGMLFWENLMVPQIPVFGSSFMGHGTSGCLDKKARQLIEAR